VALIESVTTEVRAVQQGQIEAGGSIKGRGMPPPPAGRRRLLRAALHSAV
jgi:hypothetical protein